MLVPEEQVIHQSWSRSKELKVDPHRARNDILAGGELNDRKGELHDFFTVTDGILEQLFLQLRKTDFMVIVSDLDGYIVHSWGEPPFCERAKNVWLDTGANWNERVKGTNAIGTSLAEQSPVSVVGGQHYCAENHFLTCYAAPLFSPTGELLGVLDVSGDARHHHPHTMGMVIAAAQACQARLLLKQAKTELTLALHESDTLMGEHRQPLLSVNENGMITRLNEPAANILGKTVKECVGHPLSRWFKDQTSDLLSSDGKRTKVLTLKPEYGDNNREWAVQTIMDERKRSHRTILKPLHKQTEVHRQQKNSPTQSGRADGFVIDCPRVKKVLKAAEAVARTDATVLVHGETGAGKELVAQTLHRASGRKGPFVVINCGALPEHLMESELFGYEQGAFTGASKEGKKGKFEAADGGTLFLDEIGELPLASQAVLLRVLEEKRVTRLGGHQARPIDVRIVAATNRNLPAEVEKKHFRSDLYYRLCEFELQVPPLRERQDFPDLVAFFMKAVTSELKSDPLVLDPVGLKKLKAYHWPGNIRELKQVIRQACYNAYILRGSMLITAEDLVLPQNSRIADGCLLENQEERAIGEVLEKTKGNISEASRLLGISRTTLYRKLNQYEGLQKIREGMKGEPKCS